MKTNAGDLARELGWLKPLYDAKTTVIPAYAFVRVEPTSTTSARLTATTGELIAQTVCPAATPPAEPFLIPAGRLHDLVRQVDPDDAVTLTPKDTIRVKAGRVSGRLQTLPLAEFPEVPEPGESASTVLPRPLLRALLPWARLWIDTYYSSPQYPPGALVEATTDHLRVVSTNGHCMAIATAPGLSTPLPPTVLPRPALDAVGALLEATEGDVSYAVGAGRHISFTAGCKRVASLPVDRGFPAYQALMDQAVDRSVSIDRQALLAAIGRAAVAAATPSKEIARTFGLASAQGALTVSAESADIGQVTDSLPIEGDAEIQVTFQVPYVVSMLRAAATDTVRFEAAKGDRLMRFRFTQDDVDVACLVSPIRK